MKNIEKINNNKNSEKMKKSKNNFKTLEFSIGKIVKILKKSG